MKYTIKGKEYTELDINKRCAELMGFQVLDSATLAATQHKSFRKVTLNTCWIAVNNKDNSINDARYDPCSNPSDTWPIIEKCWAELMEWVEHSGDTLSGVSEWGDIHGTRWEYLMLEHNCTMQVAACICLIGMSEGE